MKIRVISDNVLLERRDHVPASPSFKGPCLFAHHFEGGTDVMFCKQLGEPFGGAIRSREKIILGVEPENNINARGGGFIGGSEQCARKGEVQEQSQNDSAGGIHTILMH